MLPYTELLFAPGRAYSYSNPGVIFLGRTIEVLTGDDYEVYVTKNILRPWACAEPSSTAADTCSATVPTAPSDDAGLHEARFDFDSGTTVSNGGLNAPLGDMAIYLGFLIGDPKRADYEIVLKRASLEECGPPKSRVLEEKASTAATPRRRCRSSSSVTAAWS